MRRHYDMATSQAPARPRVLFVSSEVFPLAKTGGLADVSAALPLALARLGVDIRLMLPAYPQAIDRLLNKRTVTSFDHPRGCGRIIEGLAPDSGLPVYLYDAPDLYARPGTLYQGPDGQDWPDNHLRYAALCHAASKVALGAAGVEWQPDIVHANDWHTGLLPAILANHDGRRPETLFTIHNMAFQGNFGFDIAPELGLPASMLTGDGIEFYGKISFLKAGLRYADRLTTVSPTYAKEILTPEFGAGMDGLLRARANDLTGILNGVDYSIWDPSSDMAIAQRYGAQDLSGKSACKAALQDELGLDLSSAPLIVFVNRITDQKMADIVLRALPELLANGAQLVVHGQGNKELESAFLAAAHGRSTQFSAKIGYDESFTRRLTAAADMSLTASRFEPCGLTTMYAMRYGALPITRPVGGIADTVVDPDSDRAGAEGASGFMFKEKTPGDMAACVRRATDWFNDRDWKGIQKSAMRRDFGWERSAQRYLALYRDLMPMPEGQAEPATVRKSA